jgi:hypothetical protein
MLRIRLADHAHDTLSGDHLTIFAALFYRCLYFHVRVLKKIVSFFLLAPLGERPGEGLLIPIRNPPLAQVIRGKLDRYAIPLQDLDVVHPHLTGDTCKDLMAVFQLHSKRCVRQRFFYNAIDRDRSLFGHLLLFLYPSMPDFPKIQKITFNAFIIKDFTLI